MSDSHITRIRSVQKTLSSSSALLISDPLEIFYLTDFTCLTPEEREAYVFITKQSTHLFLSSFSTPTELEGMHVHVGSMSTQLKELLPKLCLDSQITSIQFDGNSLRYNEYQLLKPFFPTTVSLTASQDSPLSNERMVKNSREIEAISKANAITHSSLNTIFTQLKVGMTEVDVQQLLEQEMRKLGVTEFAFPTIVCFGDHTALPHHQPGNRELKDNHPVLIDCGAKWQKYCADVTRTSWFGTQPDPEFTEIEEVVKEAYKKTFAKLTNLDQKTSTTLAANLDLIARSHISAAGFGPDFIHTTGHGVGLYIHEQPSLNQRNQTELKPGMIITIEPGIYLENKFGYRFENSILITEKSAKELL
ncbi:MAG: M24 family metallopeptidase [Patescibacteria group bacterium]